MRKSRLRKILDGGPGDNGSPKMSTHAQTIGYLEGMRTSVAGGAWEPVCEYPESSPRPPGPMLTARTENIARTVGYGCFGKRK